MKKRVLVAPGLVLVMLSCVGCGGNSEVSLIEPGEGYQMTAEEKALESKAASMRDVQSAEEEEAAKAKPKRRGGDLGRGGGR